MSTSSGRVVIVGAGATGLAAACELARRGIAIDLLSLAAPRRTVVASSGDAIAAAVADRDDDVEAHARDATPPGADSTRRGAIRALVNAAPRAVDRLVGLGVPLLHDDGGIPARKRGSGHLRDRLATAGVHTKREIVEALDRELAIAARAHPGRVRRLEGWELVEIVVVDETCAGVVARDLRSMEVHAIPARAVLLASGGFGGAWRTSAAPRAAVGSAIAAALRAGAALEDVDMVDVAPLAIATRAKRHPISDFVRSAGARVWIPLDPKDVRRGRDVPSKERRELLRPRGDEAGHLVRPAVGAQTIARALFAEGVGIFDAAQGGLEPRVYVDLGHLGGALPPEAQSEVDRLARVTGVDLAEAPARAAPAVTDTLGGIAVGFELDDAGIVVDGSSANHETGIAALYAAGSAASAYRGHGRLPGHRLLEALVGGELAARAIATRLEGDATAADRRGALEAAEASARSVEAAVRARSRGESARAIGAEVADVLDALVGLAPAAPLDELATRLDQAADRAAACSDADDAASGARGAVEVRRVEAAVLLARAAVASARARRPEAAPSATILVRFEAGAFSVTSKIGSPAEGTQPGAPTEVAP